jgi:putative transposase
MKHTITAKLKLNTTPDQYVALRQTQLAYRDALNYVCRYAFEHGKMSSARRLQQETYNEIRAQSKLPSQMTCSVIRQVAATYKALWTKLKRNVEHRKAKITRKRFKGLEKSPKYLSPTLTYVYGHDYSFKIGQRVSVLSLGGRVIVGYSGYDKHVALIKNGAAIGEAKLWYDKPRKQLYLLVSLELDRVDPTPESLTQIVGVDVGMRYLATAATMSSQSQFHRGRAVRTKADHYARLRKRLQCKGTRTATRRLIAIGGRERRLKLQTNHCIAKSIVESHPHSLIGLEELTGIREHNRRRARRRKKKGKGVAPVTLKARRANRHGSKWAFAELQGMIAYKAGPAGSIAVKVDADYTSKACPMCGYIDKKNRPQNGLLFVCQNNQCPYRLSHDHPYMLHADLVGARNIAMRTFCVRQDWIQTGQLSVAPGSLDDPDASGKEAKAARLARLARYAELRWSSDASLLHEHEAI